MITVVVLTKNEGLHIERCLESVRRIAARIVVVDSGSTDSTVELARTAGAEVYENAWTNHATQFNWALDSTGIETPWVFRVDADEVLSRELEASLQRLIAAPPDEGVTGFTVNRRIRFLGRSLRWGGVYPRRILRVFRRGRGRAESRWMDEHIHTDGRVLHLAGDLVDDNLNGLTWWTSKHNGYASREVADLVLGGAREASGDAGAQARSTRWAKNRVYARAPAGLRALLFFGYRYVFRLGFLDGWEGFAFHVLQGFWYRFLVDAKLVETKKFMQESGRTAAEALLQLHGLDVEGPESRNEDG